MDNSRSFVTYTLSHHPFGNAIIRILDAAIQSVEPGGSVQRYVHRDDKVLIVDGQKYPLEMVSRIHLVGLGKAAYGMTKQMVDILEGLPLDGVMIPKHQSIFPLDGIDIQIGGHPVPDANSITAGKKVIELVESLGRDEIVICLISGGGSALMVAPQDGLLLQDIQELTSVLLRCGASIHEINIVRRHLDRLKGGGLVKLASPARVISLILSDVVGNSLETIASGPTAPDPSSRIDAMNILAKYNLFEIIPNEIIKILGNSPENPKPGDTLFNRVQNVIIGSNQIASETAMAKARIEGFNTFIEGNEWQGEAREVAVQLCNLIEKYDHQRPACIIAGGETTVTIQGNGKGGRNQELALAAVSSLAKIPNALLITLATDGEDGTTDAAGAVVSSNTLERGSMLGISPNDFLKNNDSYYYFSILKDLLRPGSTGTNVNDLLFIFLF